MALRRPETNTAQRRDIVLSISSRTNHFRPLAHSKFLRFTLQSFALFESIRTIVPASLTSIIMPPAASKKRKVDANATKYYAVRAGYKPGVYTNWSICQQQISGFKGAQCA